MKPIKAVRASISEDLPPLYLLFAEEDDVIVVRCLDFSISSHGDTVEDAVESLNDVLIIWR